MAKTMVFRMLGFEVAFAPSVQYLTCEVNIHHNLTTIPPLTTYNAQFEHVNLTQTTVARVQCQSESGWGPLFTNRVQWNNRFEAALAGTETLHATQRDREMRSVRFDVELLAEGGVHRDASRDSSISSHADRSHSPT